GIAEGRTERIGLLDHIGAAADRVPRREEDEAPDGERRGGEAAADREVVGDLAVARSLDAARVTCGMNFRCSAGRPIRWMSRSCSACNSASAWLGLTSATTE